MQTCLNQQLLRMSNNKTLKTKEKLLLLQIKKIGNECKNYKKSIISLKSLI